MNKLYILTGPAGVGKSTISNRIASSLEKSALIEGDEIYHQVVGGYIQAWKDGNHLKVFWKVCISIIKEYLENGYDVVFNYIIEKEDIEVLKENFKKYDIKFTVLMVNEKMLLDRDKERPEDCRMNERCIVLLNEFKEKYINCENILYTDYLTIDETVKEVINNDKYII